MKIFKRKPKPSTIIYCQDPRELPYFDLFSRHDLTLKISKITIFEGDPVRDHREAKAYGIILSSWQRAQPAAILPVELEFLLDPLRDSEAGSGRGFVEKWSGDDGHFRAQFFVNDPDGAIFGKFQLAFEHAVSSGLSYLNLVLRKEKWEKRHKRRRDFSPEEKLQEDRDVSEAYEELKRKLKAGETDLPDIHFDQVLFEDCMTLKAPRWSYTQGGDDFTDPIFHSAKMAKWREQRERNAWG